MPARYTNAKPALVRGFRPETQAEVERDEDEDEDEEYEHEHDDAPGDNVPVEVGLDKPIAVEPGSRFALREGGKTVGSGVVTRVLD